MIQQDTVHQSITDSLYQVAKDEVVTFAREMANTQGLIRGLLGVAIWFMVIYTVIAWFRRRRKRL